MMKTLTCPGSLSILTVLVFAACGDPGAAIGNPGLDVGGQRGATWKVSYGDTMEVMVRGATGAVSRKPIQITSGGSFTIGSLSVDVEQLCARQDIVCPQDVFPEEITLTQPQNDRHILFATYARRGPLKAVSDDNLLGSMGRPDTADSRLPFAIALGVGSAGQGACGLLDVSYATGQLTTGPLPEDPLSQGGVQMDGTLVTSYTAGCVTGAQTGVDGLSVELRVPFAAHRQGPTR